MNGEPDKLYKIIITVLCLILGILYCVCPIDIIPDAIPVAGWIDDGSAIIGIIMFIKKTLSPTKVADNKQSSYAETKVDRTVPVKKLGSATVDVNNNVQKEAKQKKEQEVNKELDLF